MNVPVLFRVWRNGAQRPFALFPTLRIKGVPSACQSYGLQGPGEADYNLALRYSKRATPAQYADLAVLLRKVGYRFTVRQRGPRSRRKPTGVQL